MADSPKLDGSGIGGAEISLRQIKLHHAPTIAEVLVQGDDATFSQSNYSVTMPTPYRVTATLTQTDLAAFVVTKLPDRVRLKSLILSEAGIELVIEAVVIIAIRVQVTLKVHIIDGQALDLVAENVSVLGTGPRTLITNQLQQLNPILSADDLPIKVTFTEISHVNEKIVIKGLLPNVISRDDFTS